MVKNGTDVTIFISAATSFDGFDKCTDSEEKKEDKLSADYLNLAIIKDWQDLLKAHEADYHQYFNRVSFQLGESTGTLILFYLQIKDC